MDGHSLLLPFDTDDPQFVRGFEAGRLWALLRASPEESVEEYAHASNAEMILRLGEATGREVASDELGNDWLFIRFEAARVGLEQA
jgi:hypothetical protein